MEHCDLTIQKASPCVLRSVQALSGCVIPVSRFALGSESDAAHWSSGPDPVPPHSQCANGRLIIEIESVKPISTVGNTGWETEFVLGDSGIHKWEHCDLCIQKVSPWILRLVQAFFGCVTPVARFALIQNVMQHTIAKLLLKPVPQHSQR